jgi:wyosine [tRNA(Phe)-imidazoG37] synthetase (radical SAM superfamily)
MLIVNSIIFGPVNSRRLGRSLGVNLTPYKTCNMDCVYCECGETTCLTNERKDYYDPETVLKDISEAIEKDGNIDFVTFAGSGEPSLFKSIKKITKGIKQKFPKVKLAIITNSTLLTNRDVFDAFLEADVLLPSIDSALEEGFKKMNRPHPSLKLSEMLDALLRFKKEYKGEMWAEVFICHGINDTEEELKALKAYLSKLNPERIQINSLDRSATEGWVKKVSSEDLNRVAEEFKGLAKVVEIVSKS